jgi:hypothetical protein
MADRMNWERERMRDRSRESNRENLGRGREDWRDQDRERDFQYSGEDTRNRDWEFEANQRRYEGYRGQEAQWQEDRGYRGTPGNRDYESGRGYDESRGYGYEGSRSAPPYGRAGHGDYGPGAFTRQFRGGTELYGTGQRGYGTTWGGAVGGYSGGAGGLSGGIGTYSEPGRYVGRGPKGYQRSDERIREDICERLTQHPYIDAAEIEIQVRSGEVYLTGSVESRDEKRMAEDVADSVSGVKDVHNQLRTGQLVSARQGSEASRPEMVGSTAKATK